jgi:hypothetical protein
MKDQEAENEFLVPEERHKSKTRASKGIRQRIRITCSQRKLQVKIGIAVALLVIFLLCHRYLRIVKRYNSHSYYINYRKKYDRCEFKANGAQPAVLMALGRSGSSVTWDTLSRLSGDGTTAHEITGGNQNTSLAYFNDIKDHINENWATLRLCNIQQYYIDKSKVDGKNYKLVGFQWKPYKSSFNHHYAIDGLRKLAADGMKIIYLTRNPLDR